MQGPEADARRRASGWRSCRLEETKRLLVHRPPFRAEWGASGDFRVILDRTRASFAALIAWPTWRWVCSATWTRSPMTVVGSCVKRPTPRGFGEAARGRESARRLPRSANASVDLGKQHFTRSARFFFPSFSAAIRATESWSPARHKSSGDRADPAMWRRWKPNGAEAVRRGSRSDRW